MTGRNSPWRAIALLIPLSELRLHSGQAFSSPISWLADNFSSNSRRQCGHRGHSDRIGGEMV